MKSPEILCFKHSVQSLYKRRNIGDRGRPSAHKEKKLKWTRIPPRDQLWLGLSSALKILVTRRGFGCMSRINNFSVNDHLQDIETKGQVHTVVTYSAAHLTAVLVSGSSLLVWDRIGSKPFFSFREEVFPNIRAFAKQLAPFPQANWNWLRCLTNQVTES